MVGYDNKQSALGHNLFFSLFFSSLLLGYGLIKYRGMLTFSRQGLLFAGLLLVLVVAFVVYVLVSRDVADGFGRDEIWAQQQGVTFGLLAGLFWIGEIVADNIVATPMRLIGIICIVGVLVVTFLGGVYGAWHTKTFRFGLRIGLWSGMLSSLVAWIIVMFLTYILMERLQHYPQYIQGFAHSGDPDIMTYLVKNAIFASAAHLVFGPLLGLALGALGALLGKALVRARRA